eukprot:m.239464 g.239464  ORF g.239464 m.239464 type:complete len:392 (-) comp33745_c5_seq1:290-1465(-)
MTTVALRSRSSELDLLQQLRQQKEQLASEIQSLKGDIKQIQIELDELDENSGDEDNELDEMQKKRRAAIKLFNQKPKKGLLLCVEAGLVENTEPKSVAAFFHAAEGLKKGAIGEYMGEGEALNIKTLAEFAQLHAFANLDFDQALRKYLWSFRLPGEAQKIDRMMESFAARYVECNPGIFSHQDTCYVLAFSVIMLNTALHNPSVKQKQTLESFINMNRGIDQGGNLPDELLEALFNSIEQTPFQLPEDEDGLAMTFFNPERDGYLVKEGGRHKAWKKRWFSLVNNCLYYFEGPEAVKPKGTIPLENLFVREISDSRKPNCFEILYEEGSLGVIKGAKTNRKGQIVQGRHSSYKMQAKDRTEMEEWIKCIRAAMQKDPVYEMYRLRKQRIS